MANDDLVAKLLELQQARKWTLEKLASEMQLESSYLGRVLRRERPVSPRVILAAQQVLATPPEAA